MTEFGMEGWRQYPFWARGPAQIEDGEIALDEERAQTYYLFESTDLLFDLADLVSDPANPDPRNAITFVRRHGLLWHGEKDLGSGKCRESLEEWWDEACTLAATTDLYVRLKDSVRSGSAEPLLTGPIDYAAFEDDSITKNTESLIEFTSLFLAEMISTRLEGCSLGITSSMSIDVKSREPLSFLLMQNPTDLVSGAYIQLAQAMANRVPVEVCPGCGKMFMPESGKQKYCTTSCANTSRWRRWHERQNASS
jgi:hypothetical protein